MNSSIALPLKKSSEECTQLRRTQYYKFLSTQQLPTLKSYYKINAERYDKDFCDSENFPHKSA